MKRLHNSWLVLVTLGAIALMIAITTSTNVFAGNPPASLSLSGDSLSADQTLAQEIAVIHPDVVAQVGENRAAVFTIDSVFGFCENCWQVNIYDYTAQATINAIVDIVAGEMEAVYYLENTHPVVNNTIIAQATEAVLTADTVAEAIGRTPQADEILFMHANHLDSVACSGTANPCIATIFIIDGGVVWVLYDVSAETIDKIWWGDAPLTNDSHLYRLPPSEEFEALTSGGCWPYTNHSQDGWSLSYGDMASDSMELKDITYNGMDVATSIKLVEWHADYGSGGFVDYTGCGSGDGFPISPFGEPLINNLFGGFEIVRDFRMGGWGGSCSYRYEQRFQFWGDGSWRVVSGAYGQGCGDDQDDEAIYRPVVRINVAVDGDAGDSFAMWNDAESSWDMQSTEFWHLQSGPYSTEGYLYRLSDVGGMTYFIEPGQGQFFDGGTGDNAYMYVTQHHASEGDADMTSRVGNCCNDDHQQGPEQFVNGESIDSENLVLWYVPQSQTITTWQVNQGTEDEQYCWTDNQSSTWPCFSGPKFVPEGVPTAVSLDSVNMIPSTTTLLLLALLTITLGTAAFIHKQRSN